MIALPSIDPVTAIVTLAGLASFLTVIGLGLPVLRRRQLTLRMRSVGRRREELQQQRKARLEEKANPARQDYRKALQTILERLRIAHWTKSTGLRNRLAQAGWRHQSAAVIYVSLRLVSPLVFGLAGAVVLFGTETFHMSMSARAITEMGIVLFGFALPPILLTNAIQRRQVVLGRAFPDALDLMVVCIEAGASIEAAFQRVTAEIGDGSPEIAQELGLTSAELAFLGDRRLAYENLAMRTGLPAFKALATTLTQAERYGTSVGAGLRVLAEENRTQRILDAEKKAGALPAKLTVPMIVFFLPVLFIVILGPAVIQVLKVQ